MILTTILILLLIGAVVHGYHRGLLQMILTIATYVISWLVASAIARLIGSGLGSLLPAIGSRATYSSTVLNSVDNDLFFYHGLVFLIAFIIVSLLCHWLIHRLDWLTKLPLLGTVDRLVGAGLSLLITYIIIYVFLLVLQLLPAGWWQMQLANSELAQIIIAKTPVLAQLIIDAII